MSWLLSRLSTPGTSEIKYPISAGELAAGVKSLTGVPNASYEVRLMNTTFSRGSVNLVIEGDILLAPGGNPQCRLLTLCRQEGCRY
ncbi:MAG: hypothetical protein MZV63_67675 [Marinilabiliales bacterium]|nr:hypothetical protein [Marinilabiliales bacterium]